MTDTTDKLAWRESPLQQYPKTRVVLLADGESHQTYCIACNDPLADPWTAECFRAGNRVDGLPSMDAAKWVCEDWEAAVETRFVEAARAAYEQRRAAER